MNDSLLLAIAINDTVTLAVADADGAVIVQTAYPNDARAGPDAFLNHLMEEAQVLLYPLPGQLRQVGLVTHQASHALLDSGLLSARLSAAWEVPVWTDGSAQTETQSLLDRAVVLARGGLG